MENEAFEVEDEVWEDRKSSKEDRKEKSEKEWQKEKESWQKLEEVEEYTNDASGKWIQKGPYIVNRSAKLEYGTYIGMDYVLIGTDSEGKPILKKR